MQRYLYILPLLLLMSCATIKSPETEFRGVWIATVANIDWPKKPEDTAEKKKKDFKAILDFYKEMNFNAAIVQVRTAGDAFYETDLAPWSKYLSYTEGNPPMGFENPLKWMIEETHKRGMEFHAWLNPYRATVNLDTSSLSKKHDYYRHPNWMIKYGTKFYYDPGNPEVQENFNQIIEELVSKYEIDAIHFDDYFYPYKIENVLFDDSTSYKKYGLPNQSLADWRRSNVDSLVKHVHSTIKKNKPWVQFGISPFGVWKNKSTDPRGSDTQAGQTTYEDLYADPVLWVEKGWLDYLAPQVYWSMDYLVASYRKITDWWANTTPNTHLYVGNGTYKIKNNSDKAWDKNNEIPKQLSLARQEPNIDGNIFFSAKSLIGKHEKVNKKLKRNFYRFPSNTPGPLNQTIRSVQLAAIKSKNLRNNTLELCISHVDSIPRFVNIFDVNGKTRQLIAKRYLSENENTGCFIVPLNKKQMKAMLGLTILDAFGNESKIQDLN